jgi:ABC-type multidrug transport system fused ATPase/permease subunit
MCIFFADNVFNVNLFHACMYVQAQRVSLSASIASQWLTLRLQMLGLVIVVSIAMLAVINAAYEIVPISGSRLGLSLSYAFSLVGYLNGLVDSLSRSEQEMISVERVAEYIALPDEFSGGEGGKTQESEVTGSVAVTLSSTAAASTANSNTTWPQNGRIELYDVSFSYAVEHHEFDSLVASTAAKDTTKSTAGTAQKHDDGINEDHQPYALSHISLEFGTGSRTVVIGRTGRVKTIMRTVITVLII